MNDERTAVERRIVQALFAIAATVPEAPPATWADATWRRSPSPDPPAGLRALAAGDPPGLWDPWEAGEPPTRHHDRAPRRPLDLKLAAMAACAVLVVAASVIVGLHHGSHQLPSTVAPTASSSQSTPSTSTGSTQPAQQPLGRHFVPGPAPVIAPAVAGADPQWTALLQLGLEVFEGTQGVGRLSVGVTSPASPPQAVPFPQGSHAGSSEAVATFDVEATDPTGAAWNVQATRFPPAVGGDVVVTGDCAWKPGTPAQGSGHGTVTQTGTCRIVQVEITGPPASPTSISVASWRRGTSRTSIALGT